MADHDSLDIINRIETVIDTTLLFKRSAEGAAVLNLLKQLHAIASERGSANVASLDAALALPTPLVKVYERPHGLQELRYYTPETVEQIRNDAYSAGKRAALASSFMRQIRPDDIDVEDSMPHQTCWCHACNANRKIHGIPFAGTRMILCPGCGNKRCPHALDHRYQCTKSNELGQVGRLRPGIAADDPGPTKNS